MIFLGKFHQGIAYGPCWRFYDGGGYLYGMVNNEGAFSGLTNFTYYHIWLTFNIQCYALTRVHCKIILHLLLVGSDITYLYPDLATCMNGNFVNNGQMEIASLSVIKSARIEEGVMVLK